MARTFGRSVSAAVVALLVVATACNDARSPVDPTLEAWRKPPPQETGELSGTGSIGPLTDMQSFDFDVRADASGVTGTFLAVDMGRGATLATDPTFDANTSFTKFRASSSFCSVPTNGAEFDAVGQLFETSGVTYVKYTVKACDNGSDLLGMDTWSIDIPSENNFHRDGKVTGGGITKH